MRPFLNRLWRAARLDETVYREAGADKTLLRQAMLAVVLSSVASGVGVSGVKGLAGLGMGTLSALVSWLFWAVLTFWIGTRLLPAREVRPDTGALLRPLGFSSAPGLLGLLGLIPYMSAFILCVTRVWMLAAMVVAIRTAFNYPGNLRALGVCLIGWLIQNAAFFILGFLL